MGIEAAAWHLAVTPEMVWSAMGTSQKVDTRHALLCLLHSLQVGGDLTVQQYQELGLGEEEQFWEERSNQELLEGVRQRKVELEAAAYQVNQIQPTALYHLCSLTRWV